MDLGIKGKKALVCASSKGLGRGCAEALAAEGVDLVLNARTAETLEATAAEIRAKYGVTVTTVAADIASAEGQAAVIETAKNVDILVNNAGGPPAGKWTDWDREDFIAALDAQHAGPDCVDEGAIASDDGQGLGAGGQHHLALGQGADRCAGAVELGPCRADWLCRRHCTPGGTQRRDHQQPAARQS